MKVLLTGCNRGIGLELARQFSQDNEVHCLTRSVSDELSKLNTKTYLDFDYSNDEFLENTEVIPSEIDIAVFNAGMGFFDEDYLDIFTLLEQFMVNAISQVALAHRIQTKFKSGTKLVFISSVMGSTKDNSGQYYGYRASKAALNNLAKTLSQELKEHGITVLIFHPGYVQTEMTEGNGNITPNQSAKNIIDDIARFDINDSGIFWHTEDKCEIPF